MFVAPYKSADEVARSVASILRPPRRIRPSEAAAGRLVSKDGDIFDPEATPYLAEPLDLLASRIYQGIVFVGPARTGKTFGLVIGGVYYIVTVEPADTLMVHMSQDSARDFSRQDLDRAIKNTPELQALMSPRARDDNTYDKFWRHGMVLKIVWPAASQIRGKTMRYVWLIDHDGASSQNVDGRGSLWGQAFKRIETFMSRGKCVAESSPGFPYDDPEWRPSTPHEAPPAPGIMALYNAGTRARWYVRCVHCGEHFEAKPGLEAFAAPADIEEIVEAVQRYDLMMLAESWAKVPCPHCGGVHEPEHKRQLNAVRNEKGRVLGATWVHEGQRVVDCRLEGEPRRTNIASFWLGGMSAAYQPWVSVMFNFVSAVATYVRTGDESDLRRTTFEDLAYPYLPMAVRRHRSGDYLSARRETWPKGEVPEQVRFLTAAVDVQQHAFVVHVMGWGVGLQSWLVDRFRITASKRPEGERFEAISPGVYIEDWELLIEQVLERTWPCVGKPGWSMKPVLIFGDSGGSEGVTLNAYAFWRHLQAQYGAKGYHLLFRLIKGDGNINAPLIKLTYPDTSGRKDRNASKGDVPVYRLNTTAWKDAVHGDISRKVEGPGFCHIPDWVDDGYFDEMTAEIRKAKGWERQGNRANEAFDLHYYNRAAAALLQADQINWDQPPPWADQWERNPYVLRPDVGNRPPIESVARPGRRVLSRGI